MSPNLGPPNSRELLMEFVLFTEVIYQLSLVRKLLNPEAEMLMVIVISENCSWKKVKSPEENDEQSHSKEPYC